MGNHIHKRLLAWPAAALFAAVLLMGIEVVLAIYGMRIPYHPPPRAAQHLGVSGSALRYVVMGDSTAAGQGCSRYERGIAMATARYLGGTHRVTIINIAVSGATAADVLRDQLPQATPLKPDIVLIALGANDATHFTSTGRLRRELDQIIETLLQARCDTRIVLTGSPDLGGVWRFAQPLRWFAGTQSERVNAVYWEISQKYQLTWAPIAAATGPLFRRDPSLLAADRFHPNDRGYAAWVPVLEIALNSALTRQPSHCGSR